MASAALQRLPVTTAADGRPGGAFTGRTSGEQQTVILTTRRMGGANRSWPELLNLLCTRCMRRAGACWRRLKADPGPQIDRRSSAVAGCWRESPPPPSPPHLSSRPPPPPSSSRVNERKEQSSDGRFIIKSSVLFLSCSEYSTVLSLSSLVAAFHHPYVCVRECMCVCVRVRHHVSASV